MADIDSAQAAAQAGDPFEIEVVEVRGVPTRTWKHAPQSLREVWDASAVHGPNDYLVYGSERYTFDDAHKLVRNLAARLITEYGVQPGDRVAIATRNYPEWAVAFFASTSVGAVVVPLNAWWTGPELAYGLSDSGSVVLFADDERIERIQPHLDGTDVRHLIAIRTDRDGIPWADAVAGDGTAPLPAITIDTDDDATIMYTSGTTGKPKGATATHRNICSFLYNGTYRTRTALQALGVPDDFQPPPPSTLLTFPLFHVGGLQSFLLPFTMSGGKVVLMFKWDPKEAVVLVDREQVTSVAGVPLTVFQLLETAQEQGTDLPSLTGISSGATLVPPELVRRIDDQFASRAAPGNGYGLTETSGAAIANFGQDYVKNPTSVGKPIAPVLEVSIRRADDSEADVDEPGEIWLKGPTVVRGYFGMEEATKAAFTDGWFHTGDMGRLDADGNLYVVDRIKDMIIRGGENIYAAEIEGALYEHADIADVAVIGIPHDRLGEEVGAVIKVRDGASLSEQDVKDHVGERLAAFKVPVKVWFADEELPRNASGKVLKRELRESLLKEA